MEATDIVEPELVNGVLEKAAEADELGSNINKGNEIIDTDSNGTSQDPPKVESLVSPGMGEESVAAIGGNKASNTSKNSKWMKDRGGRNGEANTKVILSKSLSFSAKGAPTSNLRKSTIFVKPRMDAKKSGTNGLEVALSDRPPANHTNSSAPSFTRRSIPVKSGSIDATANGTFTETLQSNDGNKKSLRHTSVKNDDDTHSTTSSTTPRAMALRKSTGSVFSFRLDERAEKRKEFFTKMEEKVHAKEVEKTNLQEKSKENQDAEIRQLRKSLTFKATPMPRFYQDPGPPKAELKKIPPTRPKSPKLGRHKPSSSPENASEGNTSIKTPRPAPDSSKLAVGVANGKVDSVASKRPTQRSLLKLPSQKSASARPETKPLGSKPKASNPKPRPEKPMEDSPAALDNDTGIAPDELLDTGIPSNEVLGLGNNLNGVLVEG